MKRMFLYAALLLSVSCASLSPEPKDWKEALPPPLNLGATESSTPPGPLRIFVLKVGQGDASIVQTPNGRVLLIDGGPDGRGKDMILPFLKNLGMTTLDTILATHYDADHIGGLDEVIAGEDGISGSEDDIRPRAGVFDRGNSPWDFSPFYPAYAAATEGLRVSLKPGDEIRLDELVLLRCVAVNGEVWQEEPIDLTLPSLRSVENSASIALLIEYGRFRYLTSGDLTGGGSPGGFETADVETSLATRIGPVTAVHVNHHGSLTSSNEHFANTLKPKAALFSVGDLNEYGHPAQEVLERWHHAGAQLWLTEKGSGGFIAGEQVVNGTIEIETDGQTWSINNESMEGL